jgi:hypothetical protein
MKYKSTKINVWIIWGIMYNESRVCTEKDEVYDTAALSPKNSFGLMQISPIGLREYNRQRLLFNPKFKPLTRADIASARVNIHVGVFLFAKMLEAKKGNVIDALNYYSHNAKNYPALVLEKAFKEIYNEKGKSR